MEFSSENKQILPQNIHWTQSHSNAALSPKLNAETEPDPVDPEVQIPTDPGPINWSEHNLYFLLNALQKEMALSTLKSFGKDWFPHHPVDAIRSSLIEVLRNKLDNSSPNIQNGFAWLAVGIAVLNLPLSSNHHLMLYILSYTAIFWGGLSVIHGWVSKKRTQRLLHGLNQMPCTVVDAPSIMKN